MDPARTVLPKFWHFIFHTLAPFLDGHAPPSTPETSFSGLRNRLAHGGEMRTNYAARLMAIWSDPLRKVVREPEWQGETSLLVRSASGAFGLLRGPSVMPAPSEDIDPKALAMASRSPGVLSDYYDCVAGNGPTYFDRHLPNAQILHRSTSGQ
jgi:hypothetical protein